MSLLKQLHDHLEKSGTGADKLAKIREASRGDVAPDGSFMEKLIELGIPDGTMAKIRTFFVDNQKVEAKVESKPPEPPKVESKQPDAQKTFAKNK